MTAALELATPEPVVRAAFGRRAAALGLDSLLLVAALLWALLAEVAVPEAVGLFVGAWLLACPLYFALYHGHGTGRTPGERELEIALVDAERGGPIGMRRAILHAVGGLVSALLVVPLALDVALTAARPDGRAWHDRLLHAAVVRVPAPAGRDEAWPEAAADQAACFAPRPDERYVAGARALPFATRAAAKDATWRVYGGLVGLSALLLPLLVADGETELDALELVVSWVAVAGVVLLSGVYWSQAAIVVALEAVRVGEGRLPLGELLRRALARANAMTLAVLVLAAFVAVAALVPYALPLSIFLVARFGLVVPALVLEGRTVHGAFLRSWQLTRGRTFHAAGLLLGTVVPVVVLLLLSLALFVPVALLFTLHAGVVELALVGGAVAFVFTLPASRLLGTFGSAWCLFYYDRRAAAAAMER
ncbi:MAG TPA: RDD family protein [Gaiellaceae bacterium]|nr:RDD family protein [Gaiellaceae bacterium]